MRNKITAGIVGYGFVGQSLHRLFGSAEIYDPYVERYNFGKEKINACDIAFVCVPTPVQPGGGCDVEAVERTVEWLESDVIVIRSTVTPGTTDRLVNKTGKNIIFQPEYVGETVNHPLLDHHSQSFIILGGDERSKRRVADFYKQFFNSTQFRLYSTTAILAELAKYMENSFFAVKVTFCNEFYDIAESFGVSYDDLRELWLADPRVNRDHTLVYSDERGFSGKCLPKDVSAIIAASEAKGAKPELLKAMMRINRQRRQNDPEYPRWA